MKMEPIAAPFTFCLLRGHRAEQRAQGCEWLRMWLNYRLHASDFERGAVIFDIDDTLVDSKTRTAIRPTVQLYESCMENGLDCFIVTARPDLPQNRKSTCRELEAQRIRGYVRLFMMPPQPKVTEESVSAYKYGCRRSIAKTHTILANLGDMWWDVIRLPVARGHSILHGRSDEEAAILFPPGSHREAALKLPAST